MSARTTHVFAAVRNVMAVAIGLALMAPLATPVEAQDPPRPGEEEQQDAQQQSQNIEEIVNRMEQVQERADRLEQQLGEDVAQRGAQPDRPGEPMRPEDTDEPDMMGMTLRDERMREMVRDLDLAAEGVLRLAERVQNAQQQQQGMTEPGMEEDVDDPAMETQRDSQRQFQQIVDHLSDMADGIEESLSLIEQMHESQSRGG